MKCTIRRVSAVLVLVWLLTGTVFGKELVAVGQVVGLELRGKEVSVAGFDDTQGRAAQAAGLRLGDIIRKIDDIRITCADDIRRALEKADGTVAVQICRDGKEATLKLTPQITKEGPKLGVYLRQGVTGIGTVTWYDPENHTFGTLGHGVNDPDGNLLHMVEGWAYRASVMTVKKGKCGQPGQLMGSVISTEPLGTLSANTPRGLFGTCKSGWVGEEMEIASADQIKTGDAVIRSTISGDKVQEYSVKILKIYPQSRANGRNLLLKVTDPALLATTGGIVQGMSGSPIIQDGKLVGAVTHVLVNDPTTGYGIFIENMLDAAG